MPAFFFVFFLFLLGLRPFFHHFPQVRCKCEHTAPFGKTCTGHQWSWIVRAVSFQLICFLQGTSLSMAAEPKGNVRFVAVMCPEKGVKIASYQYCKPPHIQVSLRFPHCNQNCACGNLPKLFIIDKYCKLVITVTLTLTNSIVQEWQKN